MRYPSDFVDGPVTERILSVLRERDAKTITAFFKDQKFRFFKNANNLITSRILLPAYLEDYLADTGYTVHDIFYGFGAKVKTHYSAHDETVLAFLNHTPVEKLSSLFSVLQQLYPNEFFNYNRDLRPTQRLREIMNRMPRNSLSSGNKAFNTPGVGHLSQAAQLDIAHYRKNHYTAGFVFDINCMVEYAEFVGVSLHWIWNLNTPLYCTSQVGDLIFDYYTMMQSDDQEEFVHFVLYCMEQEEKEIADAINRAYQSLNEMKARRKHAASSLAKGE